MKFFIDTADVREIKQALALGVLDGVTTNPSLIAKTGRPFHETIQEICSLVPGPVSAEAVAESADEFIKQGRELAALADNVCVKLPISEEGLAACKTLTSEGIMVNMTLIFQPIQALMCAKAGATFVSPFIGRLDDISATGMRLIEEIRVIFDNYGYATEILAASIRHPQHVVDCALVGADVATIPYAVISKLLSHPLTTSGIEKFNADAKKIPSA